MICFDFQKKLKGSYGDFVLDFKGEIKEGERIGIFGASGAGKSTILRILCGLERPDSGELRVCGEVWSGEKKFLPPQKRNIGFVFQNYVLFPHLNVRDNIAFGKRVTKESVDEIMQIMEIEKLAMQHISTLSGGQAQRVAIARALACKPQILLLDEPLSALDYKIKNKLIDEINLLQKKLRFVMILVSHQISEIYRLSDRIFEIKNGKIISVKSSKESFARGNVALGAEVLNIQHLGINARIEVLLNDKIFGFVCHPNELEGITVGDHIQIMLKSFSPLIVRN